jgi:beta-glucanase (GH16 family)
MTTKRPSRFSRVRVLRRVVAGAVLGIASLTTLQAIEPTGGSASAETDACGAVTLKADGTPWACSYVDNFDGKSLDPSKWIIQHTAATGFRSGLTCFTDSSKNIQVGRGELKLTASTLKGKFVCKSPSGDFTTTYTGGMIGTRTKFSQAYGRFEVRAKYPDVTKPGVHGGFWMYPLNHTYGRWPASGEIDVAEWWSVDPTLVLPSLHFNGRNSEVDSGWGCRVADPSNYHTYTVEWLPTGFSFFIDGTPCFTRTPTPDEPLVAPQPFDQPFSMILNMGVGTDNGTVNAVSSTTPLPATYSVDYAKAWH